LVELVVVLAIAALLLALALGGRGLVASRRLTGHARKLASDMRMIEQRARTERTCYRIVFNPGGDNYAIDRYAGAVTQAPAGGGSQCNDGSWELLLAESTSDEPLGISRRMPRGVDLVATTFASNTLVVSPLGNPNAGEVTLRIESGMQRQVVMEAMGRVRMLP
jgi:Tfp pilus assembly protein FimT